ncbi:monocarboxylate transporter 12-like [Asterias rubens]|uniref:monocarboxylate transporter 12-like n=1 Tax=Asterias rubens TaxID=7604 RepID=UPI0014551B7E|nr:monocarboxylate transporter 12-like [Asterias rubens]
MVGCGICWRLLSYFTDVVKEGGYVGCIAVLGAFADWMTWIAMTKSLAVMLPTLQEQFGASTWLVGWMIAIIDGTVDLAGPFAPILGNTFGVRTVFMVSGTVTGAAFICSAFATSLSTMAIILAVVGPTLGLVNILSRDLIGRYFDKHHTTALGIAGLGTSLGFIIFAPLTQFLLDLYGWKATMMLLGALFFNLTVCGALIKPEDKTTSGNGGYHSVDKDGDHSAIDDQEDGSSRQSRSSTCTTIRKLITASLQLDLFTSVRYWLVTFVTVMTWLTFAAWVIYFVPYVTISKGYSLSEAANFVLIFGIGKILGSLLVGQTVSVCGQIGLGANVWMSFAIFTTSTYFFVDPWLTASWAISVGAFFFGCFHSFMFILGDVITKEAIGVDQLGCALGWIGFKAGVVRFAFLFFPGLVFDTLGSYTLAFTIMGGINLLSFFAFLALMWLKRYRQDTVK